MNKLMIYPAGRNARRALTDGYSLEVTIRDIPALAGMGPGLPPGSVVSITNLAHESGEARIAAALEVRRLGFEPMPHLCARGIASSSAFEKIVVGAGATCCFVIAGDASDQDGPYPDSASLIATGVFERTGVKVIGVAGHPEGHPMMSDAQCWSVLETKCRSIADRGMAPLIVTQFTFDAGVLLSWLKALRARGVDHPVRIGVPGPAGVATLLRFAARCGVRASTAVLSKYGVSAGKLLRTAGPDHLLDRLAVGLGDEHGQVGLHFYPFGGVTRTVEWIEQYSASPGPAGGSEP